MKTKEACEINHLYILEMNFEDETRVDTWIGVMPEEARVRDSS